ncbi:Elongator subunit Iki1-domain-containing protein [Boeremia exigua]|uniref:Elongator subunit Iki1-domain-containing protein n=1 Tax=Boeremia exigua TaxID=749465 RepID=UPI001E8E63DD|nr:Elongator subunit Iki1-domain-containing protein [Boeremia exigua]KAH6642419.1 Elongator subunit Iki1-domain-containing protein [Boeremia exigua]
MFHTHFHLPASPQGSQPPSQGPEFVNLRPSQYSHHKFRAAISEFSFYNSFCPHIPLNQYLYIILYHTGGKMANIDWDKALQTPDLLRHLIPADSSLPDWLHQVRKERLPGARTESRVAKRGTSTRVVNCDRWIKKANYQIDGVRKRKPEARPFKAAMARPASVAQYQRHSLQLLSRVLNIRSNASPFTLILDDLNQRAMPLVGEFVRRALSRNVNVVVVSFEATRFHPAVRSVPAYGDLTGEEILQKLREAMSEAKESLVVVDSLYELISVKNVDMGALFNLVAGEFASTLVGVYHQDTIPDQDTHKAYAPQPLELFKYMATTVVTCKSFAHVLAAKAAKERSLPEPTHGLLQGAEGIVQCLHANDPRGIVIEAEFRRKSGRPESESYFLRAARVSDYNAPLAGMAFGTLRQEFVTLLDQVPGYNNKELTGLVDAAASEMESTFSLGLTDKQKQAREGVVLPYLDAQKGEGAGEGGRILYDMGEEDDFDEEEDEI